MPKKIEIQLDAMVTITAQVYIPRKMDVDDYPEVNDLEIKLEIEDKDLTFYSDILPTELSTKVSDKIKELCLDQAKQDMKE